MMYQCIRCYETWGSGNSDVDGYSHGLCAQCLKDALTPIYRKRQVQEGSIDCFATFGNCDQPSCKYWQICQET